MASKIQAPRGTFDVLPERARARARLQQAAAEVFARAGYETITTPAFEDMALFERGVGQSTDIVRKEMFTFEDKGERSLTLRPEETASICRAYLEHGMHRLEQPVKLSYLGPFAPRATAGGALPPVPPARDRVHRHRLAAGRRRGDHVSGDVRKRIDINPLRAFDSDHEGARAVMAGAPTIVGRLEGEDAEHFAQLRDMETGEQRAADLGNLVEEMTGGES